jgi:hypothetical protein
VKSPCIFDAARRDLDQKRFSSGIDLPCGENAATLIHSLKKKNRLVRSARTRRSVRSRRVELRRESARVICNHGVVGKMPLVQCRDDSVKHGASPSHRDKSRRVNMSPVIQLQSAAAEHRDVQRRYAASLSPFSPSRVALVQPVCRLRVPIRCFGPVASSLWCEVQLALQEFRHRTAVLILL